MNKATKIIIALVVVAVVALGAMLLFKKEPASENTNNGSNNAATKTITYTDSGFSPAQVTVASGDSITFVNQTTAEIEPSSNPHPVHTDNPELNVGDIEPGESKTITVTAKGTWGYHNHYINDKRGTIIVD